MTDLDSSKAKILVQLDADAQPSVFDRIVAVDAGVQHLFAYGNVQPDQVAPLVHGAIFTRHRRDLKSTAIFIGASNVAAGEALLKAVTSAFFGPLRVSVMLDANGANTTAAAAVVSAARHLDLARTTALILAGTGPVGQRLARLLGAQGAAVRLASRSHERAAQAAVAVNRRLGQAQITPCTTADHDQLGAALAGVELLFAAGASGIELLPASIRRPARDLKIAIDLNAVPPVGIEGVQVSDERVERDGATVYGALCVGSTKMKIHKAAIRSLFAGNDRVLDAEQIYALARQLADQDRSES